MPDRIRALIVDDEAPAREAIRLRLTGEPDIEVVGEAGDGIEAVRLCETIRPDVMLLDIHMPEMDGFEIVERVSVTHLPIVIFVTAYDRYALKAFETHAVDYLLKPFTESRFQAAIDRARREVSKAGDHETHQRLIALLDDRRKRPAPGPEGKAAEQGDYLVRLAVKHNHRIVLVKVDEIDWIESSANYACLRAHGQSYLVRTTMSELERRLDPARFARIHRSTIVQIDRIKDIVPAWHGDFKVTLRDGTVLKMTRNHRGRLLQ
jgi:two-component system LytT family response regulator